MSPRYSKRMMRPWSVFGRSPFGGFWRAILCSLHLEEMQTALCRIICERRWFMNHWLHYQGHEKLFIDSKQWVLSEFMSQKVSRVSKLWHMPVLDQIHPFNTHFYELSGCFQFLGKPTWSLMCFMPNCRFPFLTSVSNLRGCQWFSFADPDFRSSMGNSMTDHWAFGHCFLILKDF